MNFRIVLRLALWTSFPPHFIHARISVLHLQPRLAYSVLSSSAISQNAFSNSTQRPQIVFKLAYFTVVSPSATIRDSSTASTKRNADQNVAHEAQKSST